MLIRPLSSELQAISKAELNEIPERVEADVDHLRQWISHQPHLRAKTDDQWLLSMLRGCKFSLQKAKEKIDSYYTMRTSVPEYFFNRDPYLPEIQKILKLGLYLPLESYNGPRIFLHRTSNTDPQEIQFHNLMKVALMVMDIVLNEDDNCIIYGQCLILDHKGITINHLLQFPPFECKRALVDTKEAYPFRFKGLHIINMPFVFEYVVTMIGCVLGAKFNNRIKAYSKDNIHHVWENVPKRVIPKEYGGDGKSVEELTDEWKRKVENYKDWFIEDSKYLCDESKRIVINSNEFGVEGTFRQLIID